MDFKILYRNRHLRAVYGVWWSMPIIPATQKAKIEKITV
jgi:hypothetical protein